MSYVAGVSADVKGRGKIRGSFLLDFFLQIRKKLFLFHIQNGTLKSHVIKCMGQTLNLGSEVTGLLIQEF